MPKRQRPITTHWRIGEDLPADAYRQWRHWCQFPHYFFDDPAMRGIEQDFAAVRTPIRAANALDDLWASPESRDAFIQGYRNAPLTRDFEASGAQVEASCQINFSNGQAEVSRQPILESNLYGDEQPNDLGLRCDLPFEYFDTRMLDRISSSR